ncbi:2,3-dihydro-2,3-dihydroxybenzoate dehydrogenase [Rhodoplanes tepidamans]|nr:MULTISPECIES: SDR family oxidoreductase [Rhodoplanes]MDQ0354218.1 2,3-dihydro-2,3-dihydroxybenzoate dehydrogenase [Rhodoplanes tepidamans]
MELAGFDERVAIVTGATGGIGRAVMKSLHDAGAVVAALDRDAAACAALAREIGAGAHGYGLDLRRADDIDPVVDRVERDLGPIACLVNVAGVLVAAPALETDAAAWDAMFDVNARGAFLVSRAVARRMLPRRQGGIVTVASNAAGVPRHGMAAYAASKAAAVMITRSLGLELGRHGIRCNVVAPGSTRTAMLSALWRDPSDEAQVIAGSLETFKPGIPLGRIGEPQDVANAVLFLLSDQAAHVTMAVVAVDGGAAQTT